MTEVVVIGFTARITGGSSGTGQDKNRKPQIVRTTLSSHYFFFKVVYWTFYICVYLVQPVTFVSCTGAADAAWVKT